MGMEIDGTCIVQRRSELLFTRLDDDLLALDSQAGCCYSLNGPPARVWELIDSPTAVGSVCERLSDEYDVDATRCFAEVIELIDELRAAELVRVGEAPA
jgi:coenzyme PQQ synthesis protein D (PqqD)